MSDSEHHFESKADSGASKTYPMQAGAIRKGGYIVIKNRPCKVSYLDSDSPIGWCYCLQCRAIAVLIRLCYKLF
jgi:translation initiation factor 5A